ncbi:uncharacterized protein LOC123924218 isoform X2 [Trifolium pratense]|uniref:uncharacterized protein LOC123924218 isoform X2 n=1 Tax=Trifolium pratense TaxID=57577 RepID=UPI001E69646E|nr:uncharacterized protein LOC123924218 isoform X2 [Trifolium pratense]
MESEGQKGTLNPSAMLASLLSRRAKLHEELRNIEKQVYDMETSYLQDPGQCGNVLKGFEGFLSSTKNTALQKSLQPDEMMGDRILVLVVQKVEQFMQMDRVNQRKEEVRQEMPREQGLQVNKILIMKMILIYHDIVIDMLMQLSVKPCGM